MGLPLSSGMSFTDNRLNRTGDMRAPVPGVGRVPFGLVVVAIASTATPTTVQFITTALHGACRPSNFSLIAASIKSLSSSES